MINKTSIFFNNIYYCLNFLIIFFIQYTANLFFSLFQLFDKRSVKILKLLKNVKHPIIEKQNVENHNFKKKIVIFEMFNISENIIAFYLWSIIFKKLGNECYVYPLKIKSNFYNPISYLIYKKLGFKMLDWKLNFNQTLEVNKLIKKINFNKLTKEKFLNLKIRGIIVGELIYDHHLRYEFLATSKTDSKILIKTAKKAFEIIIYWDDFFKKNNVSSICYSHSPYLLGVPGRVAIKHNVDSLNIAGGAVYRFNKKVLYMGDQFKNYKQLLKIFYKTIGVKKKNYVIKKYKRDFTNVLSGKERNIFGTLPFFQKNTFKKNKKKKINKNSSKFKILVSAHDFYEGPNTWGKFIFPDFYEWLKFLNKYIKEDKKVERHWLVKPHPAGSFEQEEILRELFKGNKNVTILSKKITHRQLIDIKINFVLTARGSTGYQYAYFGVNTLLCSNIALYRDFNFQIKSFSKKDYKNKLNKMESFAKKKPNMDDAQNFFMMLNIFIYANDSNFIFPNINKYLRNRKLYLSQAKTEKYTIDTFKFIKKHLTRNQLDKVFYIMNNFINDKKQLILNTKFIKVNNHHQ